MNDGASSQAKPVRLSGTLHPWRDWAAVIAVVAVAGALAVFHGIASGHFEIAVGVVLSAVLAVSVLLGTAILRFVSEAGSDPPDILHALIVGMIGCGVTLMALAFTSPFSIVGNFIAVAALALALAGAEARRRPFQFPRFAPGGAYALGMSVIAAALWSRENLMGLRPAGEHSFEAYPWMDMFYHAKIISVFMNADGARSLADFSLAGESLPPYHYASYFAPALVGRLCNLQAYPLAVSIMPTLGVIWTGLAAYVFGKALGGSRVGAVAAFGALYMPDGAYSGLGNHWTSYAFFQQVAVGGLYGVSALALALTHGVESVRTRSWRQFFFAVAFLASAALFKMQVAIVHALPIFLAIVLCLPLLTRRRRLALAAAAIVLFGVCVKLLAVIPLSPTIQFSTDGAMQNIKMTMVSFTPARAEMIATLFPDGLSYLRLVARGAPLILITTYGVWLLILPVALVCAWRRRMPAILLLVPIWTILVHLTVALGFNVNHGWGDQFEIVHKPFVWAYFIVAAWCSAVIGAWLFENRRLSFATPRTRAALVAVSLAGIAAVFFWGKCAQSGMVWASRGMKMQIPRGLYDSGEFLRTHATRNAVVQFSENDPYLKLAVLSERRTFVLQCGVNCQPSPLATERFKTLSAMLALPDVQSVRARASTLGIDWLVVQGHDLPWQGATNAKPELESEDYFVYTMR